MRRSLREGVERFIVGLVFGYGRCGEQTFKCIFVDKRRFGTGDVLKVFVQVAAGVDGGEGYGPQRYRLHNACLLGKPVISVYRQRNVYASL